MRKILIYIAGLVSGLLLYSLYSWYYVENEVLEEEPTEEKTYFKKVGACVTTETLEIIQIIDENTALAQEIVCGIVPTRLIVLLYKKGHTYYDAQKIRIPQGKCAKQIGLYKYITSNNDEKTVPIVQIRPK